MNIEKLLSRIDLEDLVTRAGAKFRQNGHKDLRSACPIHGGDNQTAFRIYHDRDDDQWKWFCYTGCDCGGDAINFYQSWKGVDFLTAVKDLAAIYHVPLADLEFNQQDAAQEQERRLRINVMDAAARFYKSLLWSPVGEAALNYLRRRGFTDQTIQAARWGFSQVDNQLHKHLISQKLNIHLAYDLGLVRRDGLDFCANQNGKEAAPNGYIVFPHLVGESVVYFSSRAVDLPGLTRPDPKDKSRNLPGQRKIYRAEVKGSFDQVVIVEGPADAETLRQLGISAWALCGLGKIGEDDLRILKKRKAIYLAPDSDKAGDKSLASGKLADLADELGPLTMILPRLSSGKDFNDWLISKPPATISTVTEHIGKASTWLECQIQRAKSASPFERDDRMQEVGRLLALVPDTSKPYYYQTVQHELGLTRRDINELVATAIGKNDGKILSSIKEGCICFLNRPLGNFQARITHELTLDDGMDQPTVRYTVTGKLASGQPLDSIDVEASDFADMKWIPKSWGARPVLFISRGQYHDLARAVQEISRDMKRERVYTYTGWSTVEGKRSYLSASGRISGDGLDQSTRVDLGNNNLRLYALPQPPSGEELYQAVQASLKFLKLAPRTVTALLWAAMFAAPLTEAIALYAVLWVYGSTQSGKSTISHLALAHFGSGFVDGRQYHAPIDWMSTAASLEGAMFALKDAPIIIDDFAPQFASAQDSREMHKRAHYVIRSVGNRSSRGRQNVNLQERKTRVPRGLVISTAENPLIGQSTVGRMIYVPVERSDIFRPGGNPELDQAQEHAQTGLYAQAMAAYIQWLSTSWERAAKTFRDQLEIFAAAARRTNPDLQTRLHDYYALLAAANKLALDAFVEMGVMTPSQALIEMKANRDAILQVITQQAEMISAESPIRKYFQALAAALDQGKVYLAPHSREIEYSAPEHADLIGWYDTKDKQVIYLMTDITLAQAKEYWRALDENLDVMADALRRQVSQVPGLLAKTDQRQAEVALYIQGKTRRVLALNLEKIQLLYGVEIRNETSVEVSKWTGKAE